MTDHVHDSLGSGPFRVLYINPNSSLHFTKETVSYFRDKLPSELSIDFYTAPSDQAPPSIDNQLDGVISAAAVLKQWNVHNRQPSKRSSAILSYAAIIVGCFSAHPLVPALNEVVGKANIHVVGIFEAGVALSLQLGRTFGIATTGPQWVVPFDDYMRSLGTAQGRYIGTVGSGKNALDLHGEGAESALLEASLQLVNRGAEAILLGCAGMAPLTRIIQSNLEEASGGKRVVVVDGVQAAIELALALCRMTRLAA